MDGGAAPKSPLCERGEGAKCQGGFRGRPRAPLHQFALSQNNSSSKTKTPRGWGEQREELFVASNYTTNYQLNQWEAGDQVLRTEFNQDNQKIDAALAGLAA